MNMDTKCKTCGQTFGKHSGSTCPEGKGAFVPVEEPAASDPVSHPSHYTSHPSGVECITIAKHENFCIGNALKYLWRAGRKDPNKTIEDLKKAAQYIQYEIDRITEEQSK